MEGLDSSRLRRRVLVVVAVVCATLGLAGCGSADPGATTPPDAITAPPDTTTPSATPTPTPASAAYYASPPQSERQAIEDANAAFQLFLMTAMEIYLSQENASAIDDIARGEAAEGVHAAAAVYADSNAVLSFDDRFELYLEQSFAQRLHQANGDNVEYGDAHLLGCFDTSARTGTNPDGSAVAFPEPRRFLMVVDAVYDPSLSQWFILRGQQASTSEVLPC